MAKYESHRPRRVNRRHRPVARGSWLLTGAAFVVSRFPGASVEWAGDGFRDLVFNKVKRWTVEAVGNALSGGSGVAHHRFILDGALAS
jgi:hypothetical protein